MNYGDDNNIPLFDKDDNSVDDNNIPLFDKDTFLQNNPHINAAVVDGAPNNLDLYTDITGELSYAYSSDEDSNQSFLLDKNGNTFISPPNHTAIDIEVDSEGYRQLLSYREAGTETIYVTQKIKNKKGKVIKTKQVPKNVPVQSGLFITTFDPSGSLIQEAVPLNPGDDNSFYAETLFGIDFNGDNKLGLDISEIDEFQSFDDLDLGFDTFEGDYTNLTNLFVDAKGRLYFSSEDDPDNKKQLIDFDGVNFGVNTDYGLTPIAIEALDNVPSFSNYLESEFGYENSSLLLSYNEDTNEGY